MRYVDKWLSQTLCFLGFKCFCINAFYCSSFFSCVLNFSTRVSSCLPPSQEQALWNHRVHEVEQNQKERLWVEWTPNSGCGCHRFPVSQIHAVSSSKAQGKLQSSQRDCYYGCTLGLSHMHGHPQCMAVSPHSWLRFSSWKLTKPCYLLYQNID